MDKTQSKLQNFIKDSPVRLFLVSSLLGMSRVLISLPFEHPFEVLRVTWQTNPHLRHELAVARLVKEQKGPRGFYNGYFPNLAKQITKSSYRYPLLSMLPRFYAKLFGSSYDKNKYVMKFLTSVSLALVESVIITPFERLQVFVMTSQQNTHNYGDFYKMLTKSQVRKEIFKGFTPYFSRQLVVWISFLQADTFIKTRVRKWYHIPEDQMIKGFKLLLCSGFVSFCTILCAIPFDNIKTFLQKYNITHEKGTGEIIKKEANIPMAIRKIYERSGILGFFIGWRVKLVAYSINALFTVTLLEWLDNLSRGAIK